MRVRCEGFYRRSPVSASPLIRRTTPAAAPRLAHTRTTRAQIAACSTLSPVPSAPGQPWGLRKPQPCLVLPLPVARGPFNVVSTEQTKPPLTCTDPPGQDKSGTLNSTRQETLDGILTLATLPLARALLMCLAK